MGSYAKGKGPKCENCRLTRVSKKGVTICGSCSRNIHNQNQRLKKAFTSTVSSVSSPVVAPANAHDSLLVSGNTSEITKVTQERVKTLEQLIRVCEIDITEWEVERFLCNKWDVGMGAKAAGGTEPTVVELYQVKVWLKRKVALVDARAEIEALKEQAKADVLALAPVRQIRYGRLVTEASGNLLEINIPDLHAGKLAWGKETGSANYDSKIAEEIFERALDTLLSRVSHLTFEKVLFVVGNDLFNSDNVHNMTHAGTPQDTDVRFQKTFGIVRAMKVRAIQRLLTIAPVNVVMMPGNHDTMATWHLGDSLECYFHGHADVTVDNLPRLRKYVQWGDVMLMFTHGDFGKSNDWPLTMAVEAPEMFGATKFREIHTGHIHQARLNSYHGIKVRTLSALCAVDAWHSKKTYVGHLREAEAFAWNCNEGLISTALFTAKD